jgi:hypothetical protein
MVHNRRQVSPSPSRFLATVFAVALWSLLAVPSALAANDDNTWTLLAALPQPQERPLFALAVDPADSHNVLAGTTTGEIYRTTDRGASWRLSKPGLGRGVSALAFNPFKPGVVLAGTRGNGVWRSTDGGGTWQSQAGTESRIARAFSFTKSLSLVGTDQGVLISHETGGWSASGLPQVTVSSLAAAAVNDPSRLIAGGDASRGTEALPLFSSADGGQTWVPTPGTVAGSSIVAMLAAGPLPQSQPVRPLLMGTNTGLFLSADNGGTWQQLTGGGTLPATDFNAASFVPNHPEHFYVASDGGASELGGLWSTADSGAHFTSLKPPISSVTALTTSNEDQPTLYVATFRASDHAVMLWSYRDTGGQPKGPVAAVPSPSPGLGSVSAGSTAHPARFWLLPLLTGPEAPYLALGTLALLVLALAVVTHFRRARRL